MEGPSVRFYAAERSVVDLFEEAGLAVALFPLQMLQAVLRYEEIEHGVQRRLTAVPTPEMNEFVTPRHDCLDIGV